MISYIMLLNLLLFLKGRKHSMNKEKQLQHENIDL
ncbi:hypothetical protein SAMN05444267_100736 [Chryseobacterium polytrichastri]|uniref:Uncharacterized protein n=1 Tax=Chryseobacterium polytrichastri TaxID=1302687 RepID=A0A1M6UT53_9FLAO|nr:hypothetical protein SAMN05444267_100736 [Chryseobacterium polytrichastri]